MSHEAPYFDFLCSRCHQFTVPGRDIGSMPATEPLVCDACRAIDREPQGETVKLFEPEPTQIPGQLAMGG